MEDLRWFSSYGWDTDVAAIPSIKNSRLRCTIVYRLKIDDVKRTPIALNFARVWTGKLPVYELHNEIFPRL